jgi:hypothetical protein
MRAWAQQIQGAILRVERVAVQLEISRLHSDPRRLERSGFKAYSQSDEDGIIRESFRRIGDRDRSFVEIGCGEGAENNTRYLLHSGWTGGWIDVVPANIEQVRRDFAVLIEGGELRASDAMITAENVEQALHAV